MSKGYILIELVISLFIIILILSLVLNNFVFVIKEDQRNESYKEMQEMALSFESLMKIKMKQVNTLSQILKDGKMINKIEKNIKYNIDAIAFDKTEIGTKERFYNRFVISKSQNENKEERRSVYFCKISEYKDLSINTLKSMDKYEVANYIENMYITKIKEKTYEYEIQLKIRDYTYNYSFIFNTK